MSVYQDYVKEKTKPKKGSVYSSYLKEKQEQARIAQVPQEKARLVEKGLPTSVRKDRAAPTAVGNIVRGIVRPVADIIANVRNSNRVLVGKEEKPVFKNKYLGDIKGLGKVDMTKSPFEKENLKTIIKSAATGAEIASYLNAAGVGKKTVADLTRRGVLASKKTFAEWAVKTMPSLAKEGFGQGIAYTLGTQGREYADTGKKFSGTQAVKDIATSTIGNVVIPTLLQKGFGTSTKKIMTARAGERALGDAKILGRNVPDAGVPSAKFMTESGRTLPTPRKPGEIPIELPEPGILKSAENLRKEMGQQPTYETFIKEKVKREISTKPIKETPQPKVETPKMEVPVETMVKDAESINDSFGGAKFESGTFENWSRDLRNMDLKEVKQVAMGGKKTVQNNIPENAYLSVMKNIADETGDVKLAQELAKSDVSSLAGQGLVSSKLAVWDNIVDSLRAVRQSRLKNVKVKSETLIKEQSALVGSIKSKIKEMTGILPTKKEMDNIINSLICK